MIIPNLLQAATCLIESYRDGFNRKRIYQYRKFPTSIAALEFSPTGDRLAIAVSYTFEEGEKEYVFLSSLCKTYRSIPTII